MGFRVSSSKPLGPFVMTPRKPFAAILTSWVAEAEKLLTCKPKQRSGCVLQSAHLKLGSCDN